MARGDREWADDILAAIADIRHDTDGMDLAGFIAGMRDRVVHEYFRTSVNRVWDVVTDDLDPLEASLRGPAACGNDANAPEN